MNIYRHMVDLLSKGESFVAATILDRNGSAPRDKGAKMIIREDMSTIGTIGGGILEALVIKKAREVFESKRALIRKYKLSNKGAAQLGMVCGGEIDIFEEYIDSSDENTLKLYEKASDFMDKGMDSIILTSTSDDSLIRGRWLLTKDYIYDGEVMSDKCQAVMKYELIDSVRREINSLNSDRLFIKLVEYDGIKYVLESVKSEETVYIMGAGHIGIQLSKLTRFIGFRTVVIDDRKEFASKERFPEADEIIVVDSFENILNYADINASAYVVIVTRGHLNDRDVLAKILKTNAKYIGMIGSRQKREFVYNSLRQEGFTENDLQRVYSPIGLDIHAETPEEIAVSIAAEMIKVRNF